MKLYCSIIRHCFGRYLLLKCPGIARGRETGSDHLSSVPLYIYCYRFVSFVFNSLNFITTNFIIFTEWELSCFNIYKIFVSNWWWYDRIFFIMVVYIYYRIYIRCLHEIICIESCKHLNFFCCLNKFWKFILFLLLLP